MELTINFIGFKKIRLELILEGGLVQPVDFAFDSNLDTMLIESLDILLKENRIDSLSLQSVNVAGEVDENSSAYKVAIACAEALKSF